MTGDGRLDIVAGAFRMDLLQEMLGMSVNEGTRPEKPDGGVKEHPRVLLFENLPANGNGAGNESMKARRKSTCLDCLGSLQLTSLGLRGSSTADA